jgi:hypothetical protein
VGFTPRGWPRFFKQHIIRTPHPLATGLLIRMAFGSIGFEPFFVMYFGSTTCEKMIEAVKIIVYTIEV